MQDFAGTALPECKHPSHLRTGTPAKTLKNKLHKHLWGGWTCHNRAVLHGGGGVASRTQGQYINLQTQGSLSHESKKKQNTSPQAPHQASAWGRSQSLKIISQISLLPALIGSQVRRGIACHQSQGPGQGGRPWNW